MGSIIQEIPILELVKYIGRKVKKLQAVLLQEMEKYYSLGSKEYQEMRKIILDETSNFARSIIRQIFGDIDGLLK